MDVRPSRRKRPEVVVEKPNKALPSKLSPFVRTGARGRLLAETQNRFSQNPRSLSFPFYLSPLYLFSSLLSFFFLSARERQKERDDSQLPHSLFLPSSSLLLFRQGFLSFFSCFVGLYVRARMRHRAAGRTRHVTLTSIQINRPWISRARWSPARLREIINFTFVARTRPRLLAGGGAI